MNPSIPAAADIRALLAELSHAQMQELAKLSTVPFTTLWKIRAGITENPGIETVGKFMPYVESIRAAGETEIAAADSRDAEAA